MDEKSPRQTMSYDMIALYSSMSFKQMKNDMTSNMHCMKNLHLCNNLLRNNLFAEYDT